MMKRFSLIVILVFLTLTIVGCGGGACDTSSGCIPYNYPYQSIADYNNCVKDMGTFSSIDCPAPDSNFVTATPITSSCTPNYAYDHLVNEGQSWVVISQQQDQNNSTSSAQVTFTSTTSKTVTVTDKLDVIANLKATAAGDAGLLVGVITLNVKAEIDHEVTQTVNATIGNTYTASIPPGETAYANYGVKVQIINGHLYDKGGCEGKKSDWGTDITYVPIAVGWCVWLSNQPACPSV